MGIGAEVAHEFDEVEGIVLDVELAGADRNVAGVVPVGDIDIAIGQEADHGFAQKGRVVARHRGHKHNAALAGLAARHAEMDEIAKGFADRRLDADGVILAVFGRDRADAPVGLGDHALETALCNLAPGPQPFDPRIGGRRHRWVGGKGPRRRTKPLIGVTHGFHQVVGQHILQKKAPRRGCVCHIDFAGAAREMLQVQS